MKRTGMTLGVAALVWALLAPGAQAAIIDLTARGKHSEFGPSHGESQLTWTNTLGGGVDSYNVYRSTISGGPYLKIAATTSPFSTYLDPGPLTEGLTYYYVVREVAADFTELTQSNQASVQATAAFPPYALQLDGAIFGPGDALPPNVNTAGFDFSTLLGTLVVQVSGPGAHSVGAYFDADLDAAINTFFNEVAAPSGVPGAGLSWEIDEPGYQGGDIYANFLAGALDNTNALNKGPEDVAAALSWLFLLGPGDVATISIRASLGPPGAGFELQQFDPDSESVRIFSTTLDITNVPSAVPEPATAVLVLGGMGLLALWRRR